MKVHIPIICISLMAFSSFVGCKKDDSGTGPGTSSSDEEQIRSALSSWETAFESKNLASTMGLISDNFVSDGQTKADLQSSFQQTFAGDMYELTFTNVAISIVQDKATVSGHCRGVSSTEIFEEDFGPTNAWFWGTYWIKENSQWKMYGNQLRYGIEVSSFHTASGYYAEICVSDPSRTALSVSATGPGISGTMTLQYRSGDGLSPAMWWHTYNPFLGVAVPTTLQTFTVGISDASGTSTYSKTITGFVQGMATNLSPTGTIHGAITFSWTGFANVQVYNMDLSEYGVATTLWKSGDIPGNRTSVVYDGPALTSGHTYQYGVSASVMADGVPNASYAVGQFTYAGTP